MKKKVYLSFPIGKRDIEERRAFSERRVMYLREMQGYEVVNPLDNGLSVDDNWRNHMRADYKLMLDCDAVFFCKGWQSSMGCQNEHNVAISSGLEVIYETSYWSPNDED